MDRYSLFLFVISGLLFVLGFLFVGIVLFVDIDVVNMTPVTLVTRVRPNRTRQGTTLI